VCFVPGYAPAISLLYRASLFYKSFPLTFFHSACVSLTLLDAHAAEGSRGATGRRDLPPRRPAVQGP
jgi:hypothetical protein